MQTALAEQIYQMANLTPDKHVEFQVNLFNTKAKAMKRCIVDMKLITDNLERDICNIYSNVLKWIKKEISLYTLEYKDCLETIKA